VRSKFSCGRSSHYLFARAHCHSLKGALVSIIAIASARKNESQERVYFQALSQNKINRLDVKKLTPSQYPMVMLDGVQN